MSNKIVKNENEELLQFGGKNPEILERFMKEFFPFQKFCKIGFFTKKMKNDYYAQAKKVCEFFEYKTVFECGSKQIKCHISHAKRKDREQGFITTGKNIYD